MKEQETPLDNVSWEACEDLRKVIADHLGNLSSATLRAGEAYSEILKEVAKLRNDADKNAKYIGQLQKLIRWGFMIVIFLFGCVILRDPVSRYIHSLLPLITYDATDLAVRIISVIIGAGTLWVTFRRGRQRQ